MQEESQSFYIDGEKGSMWVHKLLDTCICEAEGGKGRFMVPRKGRSIPECEWFDEHSPYDFKFPPGHGAGVLSWHATLFRQAFYE